MLKKIRVFLIMSLACFSLSVMADPPESGDGNLHCSPACTSFECGAIWCVACNEDGCTAWRHSEAVR